MPTGQGCGGEILLTSTTLDPEQRFLHDGALTVAIKMTVIAEVRFKLVNSQQGLAQQLVLKMLCRRMQENRVQ